MSVSVKSVLKDISIVSLSSISGSIIWESCKDLYNYKKYNIYSNKTLIDLIHFNSFGYLLGFSLGISYIYNDKPLIHKFRSL